MFEDLELLRLNQEGIFPGPRETEESFKKRAAILQQRKKASPGEIDWQETFSLLQKRFDFHPLYFSAFYSNRSLLPWEGAAVWIEEKQITSIQLRRALQKGHFFGYPRKAILAHEAVHAFRSAFQEPRFEEYFAYQVFPQKWKRYLGPILQSPWEIWPFFIPLSLSLFFPWMLAVSFAYFMIGWIRLHKNHLQLKKAALQIGREIREKEKIFALLLRLKDEEIQRLSKGCTLKNCSRETGTLRWKIITLAYLV